ncbi:hypothetical protein J2S37_001126 [Corynebacterium felinum]|uniref:Secreted protein n=1 Tax=Corynebacterium felinum TaxID=131318 RepID=A0ABU2B7K1_9CORY|nr:hypothetical protein [Corynebacterium felinum]
MFTLPQWWVVGGHSGILFVESCFPHAASAALLSMVNNFSQFAAFCTLHTMCARSVGKKLSRRSLATLRKSGGMLLATLIKY